MEKILFAIVLWLIACPVFANTYYIAAAGGSDSNAGTLALPWNSFNHAMTVLTPGDTLLLQDGTYTLPNNNLGQLAILLVKVSGTSGNLITIAAQHEGMAIIDGQGNYPVFEDFSYQSGNNTSCTNGSSDTLCAAYYEIDGINFRNSGGNGNWAHAWNISGSNANFRRNIINGYGYDDACSSGGCNGIGDNGNQAAGINIGGQYLLFEDNAIYVTGPSGYGAGPRIGINAKGIYCTFRRNFIKFDTTMQPVGGVTNFQIYGVTNNIAENNILSNGISDADGLSIWCNPSYDVACSNNAMYGNIIIGLPGNWGIKVDGYYSNGTNYSGTIVKNNVVLNNDYGIVQTGDSSLVVGYNTIVNTSSSEPMYNATGSAEYVDDATHADVARSGNIGATESNTSYLNSNGQIGIYADAAATVTSDHDNFYGVTSPYFSGATVTNNKAINPAYNVSGYGNGAYLFPPSSLATAGSGNGPIGATVLYEYLNGSLTTTPLWPWPMESRINAELGISPTYVNDGSGHTGGLWNGTPSSPSYAGLYSGGSGGTGGIYIYNGVICLWNGSLLMFH